VLRADAADALEALSAAGLLRGALAEALARAAARWLPGAGTPAGAGTLAEEVLPRLGPEELGHLRRFLLQVGRCAPATAGQED
jgi:hypothetical protein